MTNNINEFVGLAPGGDVSNYGTVDGVNPLFSSDRIENEVIRLMTSFYGGGPYLNKLMPSIETPKEKH